MIEQIGLLLLGNQTLLITHMIKEQIGLHSLLLPLFMLPNISFKARLNWLPDLHIIIIIIIPFLQIFWFMDCHSPPPLPLI